MACHQPPAAINNPPNSERINGHRMVLDPVEENVRFIAGQGDLSRPGTD
ncbi:hypothetical protein DSLASN_03900 [Desulfoluna limicola]|uniref:Uncharacterized protein n=1 Tax=Desulfoluna limicola TaxID=2810562 RepID=A0ABN6EYL1_9BACT|nr:hypothetical protein [Desulfoluna limicola]BCS94758.1 hypothetical protein DSLASN_03900 [Desulfoluna limicola]